MPRPWGAADLLHDLERRVGVPQRLAELAGRGQRADALDRIVEADDEAHPPHLARGEDVDAGALLVEDRHLGRVLQQLAYVEGAQTPLRHGLARQPHPSRQSVASHHARRQQLRQRQGHDVGAPMSSAARAPRRDRSRGGYDPGGAPGEGPRRPRRRPRRRGESGSAPAGAGAADGPGIAATGPRGSPTVTVSKRTRGSARGGEWRRRPLFRRPADLS